jgi:protoporphyrinogen oxidase
MDRFAEKKDAELWLEKTPDHSFHFEEIVRYYNDAKIIVIKRDPIDQTKSVIKLAQINLEQNKFIQKKINILKRLFKYHSCYKHIGHLVSKKPDKVKLIEYEELLKSRRDIITMLCDFLGIEFEEGMLGDRDNLKSNTSFMSDSERDEVFSSKEERGIKVLSCLLNLVPYQLYRLIYLGKHSIYKKRHNLPFWFFKTQKVTVIVGAGITGLTAAYRLSCAGERCVVLEKNKEIGGCCRSFKLDDIIFDLGPHFFFYNPDFEAERFMMSLLKDEKIIKKRFRFSIFKNRKHWKFPIGLIDMILYPMEYKVQLMSRLFKKNKNVNNDGTTAKHELVEKIGITYYNKTLGPMLQKKVLLHGSKIHRDWLARVDRNINNDKEPFIPISPIKHILITIKQVLYQTYLYPANGYHMFPQKLWEKFNQLGGETVLKCGEITFKKDKDYIHKVVVGDKEFLTKNVIWTGTINDLNGVIRSNAPKIKYIKVIIVLLSYNQKKRIRRPFVYIYYPEESIIFNRIYYPSTIFGSKMPVNL